jgi:hypothetical protein
MESVNTFLALLAGLLLRLAIPIGLTVIFVYLLTRLDKRWQSEAAPMLEADQPRNAGCWDVKHCSAEDRARCSAYAHPETPCWQYYRQESGLLPERCIGCDVFKKAPVPVTR